MSQAAPANQPQSQPRRQPQSQLKQRRKQKKSKTSGCRNIESCFNVSNARNKNVAALSSPASILQKLKTLCSPRAHNQGDDQQVQKAASGNGESSVRVGNDASASAHDQQNNTMLHQKERGQRSSFGQDKNFMKKDSNAALNDLQSSPNVSFNASKSVLAQGSCNPAVFSVGSNQIPTTSARSMNAESTLQPGLGQKCESNTFPVAQDSSRREDGNIPDFFSYLENDGQGQSAGSLMDGDNNQPPFNTSDMNFVEPQDLSLSLNDNKLTPWIEVSFNQIRYYNITYKG